MNAIYTVISNSIIQYMKLQGQSADKPYLILRIHYYNILGSIDSIHILKELKVGDKIVSTIARKTKNAASIIRPKKTKKQLTEKDVNLATRHTKLGLITIKQWTKLNQEYHKLMDSKIEIMDKYCKSYKKITGTIPFFAMGDKPANIVGLPEGYAPKAYPKGLGALALLPDKKMPLDIKSGLLLHAGCDFAKKTSSAMKTLKFTTTFSNVYQIFPHSKSVLRISNCKSIDEFYSKYANSTGINWQLVMSKYDGILVENINCTETIKKPNYKKLLLDILYQKEDPNQIKNIKMQLEMKELTSLGYIWRIGKSKFVKII